MTLIFFSFFLTERPYYTINVKKTLRSVLAFQLLTLNFISWSSMLKHQLDTIESLHFSNNDDIAKDIS